MPVQTWTWNSGLGVWSTEAGGGGGGDSLWEEDGTYINPLNKDLVLRLGDGPGKNQLQKMQGDICGIDIGTSLNVGEHDLGRLRYDTRDNTWTFSANRRGFFTSTESKSTFYQAVDITSGNLDVTSGGVTASGTVYGETRLTSDKDFRIPNVDPNSGANVGVRATSGGIYIATTSAGGSSVFRGYYLGNSTNSGAINGRRIL